ncbi:ATP-dependent DNA helicase [Trichonephila clavipes]|nr:ATP-dependent DNA helicase [Trichonephila clavipes]
MRAITEQSGGLFFIDAPGGTGKTFLLSLILATIRSQNNIALAIASSGIAATLLDGGRTTHSALKLPLNLQNTEAPTCNISKNSEWEKYSKRVKLSYGTNVQCLTRKHWKRLIVHCEISEETNGSSVAHSFYCLVIFDKHCPLYHDQHPLMNFMHVLNHQFYGVIYRN